MKSYPALVPASVFMFIMICNSDISIDLKQEHSNSVSTIPFRYISNKTILPVKTGDSRTLNIILDSGLGFDGLLIMNPDLVDSIQLRNPINARINGAGNGPGQGAVFSDSMSFSVGNTQFVQQRIILLNGESFKGFSFDGVVGYSLLGHFQVEINNDLNTITLHNVNSIRNDDSSWFEIPARFNEKNIPFVDLKVSVEKEQPVKLSCYIDYASSEAIELLQSDTQKFVMPPNTEEYLLGRGLSGDIHGRKGNISSVSIGPYELKSVSAAFAPAEIRSKQSGADGVIGNKFLRRFNIIFDYRNQKIYLKPGSHFNDPF